MQTFTNIGYANDTENEHQLDIYLPDQSSTLLPLIIYVHGGAWRTDDKSTVSFIGPGLLQATENKTAVAIINYRLSTRNPGSIRHPAHLNDVRLAIDFLINHEEHPGSEIIDRTQVYLVGHSAGAHLATMAVLDRHSEHEWVKNIRGVFGIGGIYDIKGLLQQYPSYSDFVEMAFDKEIYDVASPLRAVATNGRSKQTEHVRFMVVNSVADELIGPQQSIAFVQQLIKTGYSDVGLAVRDLGDHYKELENKEFWQMVARFVLK
ncbi:hypothetical protein H4R99_008121 [Coemansia sp. RSA 1722]|nr:hypothetical protein LPJ57_006147 [Coemansia sp. RSA 486]KAJ2220555.1 hypothetical protein IWW45_009080 [Coemansia sp. RSA 485]KAJ2587519.1 hypothetical protein H4R99_008121 [Coemansia sp. RSA 1722]KAJ2602370.1 hypothetical protein GGF39_000734 [Coemansia sp. RSA 1721]